MKQCSRCHEYKAFSQFYKRIRNKDDHQSACKLCANIETKLSRNKKPKLYRDLRSKSSERAMDRYREWKRNKQCIFCSENAWYCLDLHHTDPTKKDISPAKLARQWQSFIAEAAKCVVVCSNCHRKIHYGDLVVPTL